MVKTLLEQDLKKVIKKLGFEKVDIVCSIPEKSGFGDYTTNVALQLDKQKNKKRYQSPKEIASDIIENLGHPDYLERAESAGPGFLNFFIKDIVLVNALNPGSSKVHDSGRTKFARMTEDSPFKDKKYLVEYGHVNLLKEIHIGHLRTFTLGESICRILEYLGAKVFRANYQGDIGLHIAKAIWGIQKFGIPKEDLTPDKKANFLGKAYAEGSRLYDEDPEVKQQIDQINAQLYAKDRSLIEVYNIARNWSLEYFEPIYKYLGVKYDRCFFESEVAAKGKEIVLNHVGKVFKEDQGAIIFPGENYGLHTRVFVTRAGHPTYEGKEMGLAELEHKTFPYDQSIHIVASEQDGYFQVVIKAIDLVFPELKGKKQHLSYGLVDLKEGKMSSRTGQVLTIDQLVEKVSAELKEALKETRVSLKGELMQQIAMGAIKFSYLKFSPRTNVVFDLKSSVSLQGDSGPYIQYTFARTRSLLNQPGARIEDLDIKDVNLEKEEREVLRQLEYFGMVVEQSAKDLHPNIIATYLLDLAKAFNLFYQKHPIIKSKEADFRLTLTQKVGETLKTGLYLLGIEAPERM